jgi:hypothetical protein
MDHTVRFTEAQWTALQSELWVRGDVESGAILFAEAMPSSGPASLAVRYVVPVVAEAYRARRPDFLEIDPLWMNAQCVRARRAGFSVLTVHTHLTDGPAWFSWADDQGDRRLMPALLAQMPDGVHGALNVTRSDALARVFVDGVFQGARISVAGKRLTLFPNDQTAEPPATSHTRQVLALGRAGQARLARLCVGVVGLGGTGSVVLALLARLGVRVVVLVDGDRIEESNLSRVLGSSRDDVKGRIPKVTIAARGLRTVIPDAELIAIDRPLANHDDLAALSACDVIFSCVDRLAPRALLNRFAYSSHVPVIDMGSAFRLDDRGNVSSQGGKVVVVGPGRTCLWCWGDLDAERIRVESLDADERVREAEHGYITGADEPQPSVVSFNASLASAAVTELLRMVTAFAGADDPPQRLNFDFAWGTVTRAVARARAGCGFCDATLDVGVSKIGEEH